MKKRAYYIIFLLLVLAALYTLNQRGSGGEDSPATGSGYVVLPAPIEAGGLSVEAAILGRRSRRSYRGDALSLSEVGQLLWAAQGVTGGLGGYRLRSAPSAGGTYPLELYVVVGDVSGISPGVYHYSPSDNSLTRTVSGDVRQSLHDISIRQKWVKDAPASIVFAAVYERTTKKYGDRGVRYVHMEAGHAAENVYLQAESLGLGTVVVGAFDDAKVAELLKLPPDYKPLYVMPVGKI